MINRRQFVLGSSTVFISSLLSGCSSGSSDLNIALLEGSLPLQLISNLSKNASELGNVKLKSKSTPEQLYDLLLQQQGKEEQSKDNDSSFSLPNLTGKPSLPQNDLVSLGNYWLPLAIAKQLIEPLPVDKLTHWSQLLPSFQQLVIPSEQNSVEKNPTIWGAPYRWGCTMIAYRQDKFKTLGWQPRDWDDLWHEDLKHRFSVLNHPREVIGLTLKKLGHSYNSDNLDAIANLGSELRSLQRQAKFFSSRNYLQPLILGDTWLAVGWSTDILPIVQKYENISAIAPLSGTALWADMWVKPKQTESSSKIYQWIDFCWQAKSIKQINLFTKAMSPIDIPSNLKHNNSLMSLDILNKSEFIQHLSSESVQQYEKLWQELSQV